jgi:hypothetical protein
MAFPTVAIGEIGSHPTHHFNGRFPGEAERLF